MPDTWKMDSKLLMLMLLLMIISLIRFGPFLVYIPLHTSISSDLKLITSNSIFPHVYHPLSLHLSCGNCSVPNQNHWWKLTTRGRWDPEAQFPLCSATWRRKYKSHAKGPVQKEGQIVRASLAKGCLLNSTAKSLDGLISQNLSRIHEKKPPEA